MSQFTFSDPTYAAMLSRNNNNSTRVTPTAAVSVPSALNHGDEHDVSDPAHSLPLHSGANGEDAGDSDSDSDRNENGDVYSVRSMDSGSNGNDAHENDNDSDLDNHDSRGNGDGDDVGCKGKIKRRAKRNTKTHLSGRKKRASQTQVVQAVHAPGWRKNQKKQRTLQGQGSRCLQATKEARDATVKLMATIVADEAAKEKAKAAAEDAVVTGHEVEAAFDNWFKACSAVSAVRKVEVEGELPSKTSSIVRNGVSGAVAGVAADAEVEGGENMVDLLE